MVKVMSKAIPLCLFAILVLSVESTQAHLEAMAVVHGGGGNGNASSIQTYIVHVQRPYNSSHLLSSEDLEGYHLSFLPNTTLDSGEPRLVFSYRYAMSGFAARLAPDELRSMESLPGFIAAQPSRYHPLLTTYTSEFLGLNSYGGLWHSSKKGEGVVIGVVDGGISPNHVSFADDGMPPPPAKWLGCCEFSATGCKNKWVPSTCNNKLLGAMNFVTTTPTPSALDKNGHGTHVSSLAAGNYVYGAEALGQARGTAVGVAPRAHLASYRGCDDHGCGDDGTVKSIDQAIHDGVDVLSFSFGLARPVIVDPVAWASFAAMERGILTSAAAGNKGIHPNDISHIAPWIMTVGASTMDRVTRATVRLGNGMEFHGESTYQPGKKEFDPNTMLPIVFPGITQVDDKLGCRDLKGDDVVGKVVICAYDNLAVERGKTVKAAGGAAMLMFNNNWDGYTTVSHAHVLPAAHLTHTDALKVLAYYKTDPNPTATIHFKGTMFDQRKAPAVASFSSRGPTLYNPEILKPDIVGPGVNILGAWHEQVGPNPTGPPETAFNTVSGTSMATPVLSGVAALLKASHPTWSPAMIKSAIMTTAHIADRGGDPITDEKSIPPGPAGPFAMGAGHVNPTGADDPGLVYDTLPDDYIGYLCKKYEADVAVTKIVGRQVHCSRVTKIDEKDLNYPSIMASLQAQSTQTIHRKLKNVVDLGGADEVYHAKLDVPAGTAVTVVPDTLVFSRLNQEEQFDVTVTKKGKKIRGESEGGYLTWKSDHHTVRSPIAVLF